MGDAGIKSAIQGSNVPNPDEAVPSFVSGAMAKAGKGLLEGTLQAGTSAVSDKLLDLVGLGGKSAADKGKDTRDYLDSSEISESVNFCVMEAIKLCRLDTPIIFIEARINLSRFVVTGCAAKTSATVTFPSLNLISLFAFCFNIWLNGVAS